MPNLFMYFAQLIFNEKNSKVQGRPFLGLRGVITRVPKILSGSGGEEFIVQLMLYSLASFVFRNLTMTFFANKKYATS